MLQNCMFFLIVYKNIFQSRFTLSKGDFFLRRGFCTGTNIGLGGIPVSLDCPAECCLASNGAAVVVVGLLEGPFTTKKPGPHFLLMSSAVFLLSLPVGFTVGTGFMEIEAPAGDVKLSFDGFVVGFATCVVLFSVLFVSPQPRLTLPVGQQTSNLMPL